MAETIESGIITDFLSKIPKKLSNMMKKQFDKLYADDIKVDEQRESTDEQGNVNGVVFTAITGEGHKVHVKILNSGGRSDLYDVYLVGDNGKKHKEVHQSADSVNEVIAKFIDEEYEEGLEEFTEEESEDFDVNSGEFEASKKIQITLSKVEGNEEISFGRIYSNYSPMEVYEDIENVLDNEEFLGEISEEPQCFEIIPQEDEYIVNNISEVTLMDVVPLILREAFILYFFIGFLFNIFSIILKLLKLFE